MKNWTIPKELDQPLPRRVAMKPSFKRNLILLAMVVLFIETQDIASFPYTLLYQKIIKTIATDIVLLSIVLLALWGYFKEKHLLKWGHAIKGTIVSEKELSRGFAGWSSNIVYQFTNSEGQTIEGTRNYIPIKTDPNQESQDIRQEIFTHTTILYAPDNNKKHMIYPGAYVTVIPVD